MGFVLPGQETTTLGGGCFWCLEAVFDQVQGVLDVVSDYSGGHQPDPGYELVCSVVRPATRRSCR